jgi:hypothetical protein
MDAPWAPRLLFEALNMQTASCFSDFELCSIKKRADRPPPPAWRRSPPRSASPDRRPAIKTLASPAAFSTPLPVLFFLPLSHAPARPHPVAASGLDALHLPPPGRSALVTGLRRACRPVVLAAPAAGPDSSHLSIRPSSTFLDLAGRRRDRWLPVTLRHRRGFQTQLFNDLPRQVTVSAASLSGALCGGCRPVDTAIGRFTAIQCRVYDAQRVAGVGEK